MASTNVPEILTNFDCQERLPESSVDRVCDTVMPLASSSQAASTELLLNVVEGLIREENSRTSHDADAISNQQFSEEFVLPVPFSILDIQGSARSDQGAEGTGSPPFSSVLTQNISTAAEHWTSSTASLVNHSEDFHEGVVQPPNISYSRSTVNTSVDTSLPYDAMGQIPRLHFPSFIDICDYELKKLSKEQGTLWKNFEETTSELKAELERNMAEVRIEYDKKSQEVDTEYNANAKEIEAFRTLVAMNSLLANAYESSCPVRSTATDTAAVRARSSQHSTQQQQSVQTNTHMTLTAPRPSVTTAEAPIPSGPFPHFPRCNTPHPRPISQQAAVQSNLHMNSTPLPRPSITAEARPIYSPRCNTPQPRPISQLSVVQSNTQINSTASPRPPVTSEAISMHLPPCNTLQSRPLPRIPNHTPSSYSAASARPVLGIDSTQQQQVVQANTHMSSTAPRPSVTTAEAPIPSGPFPHFPRCNTPHPRPISQQAAVQSNLHMNSTPLPRPSITAEARPIYSPRCNTPQPRPISQLSVVRSNTQINSTASPRPSVTSEAISMHLPPCNTLQPRPLPRIPNHTPSSYSAASAGPVHGIVRRTMPPHLRSSRAPNSAAASTTNPTRLAQEQQHRNSNSSLVYFSDDD